MKYTLEYYEKTLTRGTYIRHSISSDSIQTLYQLYMVLSYDHGDDLRVFTLLRGSVPLDLNSWEIAAGKDNNLPSEWDVKQNRAPYTQRMKNVNVIESS